MAARMEESVHALTEAEDPRLPGFGGGGHFAPLTPEQEAAQRRMTAEAQAPLDKLAVE